MRYPTMLYADTWEYLAKMPALQQWPLLNELVFDAVHKEPRHWKLPAILCAAAGGADEQAVAATAAIGCMFLSIVLIDDMLDDDPKGRHLILGYSATANIASALQATSLEAIARSQAPAEVKACIQNKLNNAMLLTSLGQYWDTQNPQDEESYWRVTSSKSSPFFGAAFCTGAAMGGAAEQAVVTLEEVGKLYGEMIQLYDDMHDVMQQPANVDWSQGRSPLPILFAQTVSHPERERFLALRPRIDHPEVLAEAQEILNRCGAMGYTMAHLLDRHAKAQQLLGGLVLQDSAAVEELLNEVVQPVHRLLAHVTL